MQIKEVKVMSVEKDVRKSTNDHWDRELRMSSCLMHRCSEAAMLQ